MASSKPFEKKTITARYTDVRDEPVTHLLAPIKGYQDVPLVSLENALKPVSHFFDGIEENAWVAKENCQQPADGLTQDEAASIHLYTMQFSSGPSLFYILNSTLRAENRQDLQPWFSFLKLFLTAMYKLPSRTQTVWRGVRDVDLSSLYPKGKKLAWWGVSSCTTNVEVLKNDQFLGNTGIRTIFSIESQNGKPIANHSYFKNTEEEVVLMPGSYFEVLGQLSPATGLYIIQLREINPPFPLMKPPFDKSATTLTKQEVAKLKTSDPSSDDRPASAAVKKGPTSNTNPSNGDLKPAATPNANASAASKSDRPASAAVKKGPTSDANPSNDDLKPATTPNTNASTASKLDVPYTCPNAKFKVLACDMSLHLQENLISVIIPAIDKGGQETTMAQRIKKETEKLHQPTWHCVVGKKFGSLVSHETGNSLYMKYGEYAILVWKKG